MIRLLIGSSDQVVFLNESMFSVIDFDKDRQSVDCYAFNECGINEIVCSYTNVKQVDYIADGKFYEHKYNIIHYQEVF